MKVDLEVLASTAIKRKKPWPQIIWIGEEQESLLLLDSQGKRVSVLYVPSGKTKKKLTKVSPLVEQVKCFGSTRNGRHLLGILQNGEVFVWHKDKDIVKFVEGLDTLTDSYQTELCHIDASDDCSYIFLAAGRGSFLLWVKEKGESILKDKGDPALKGSWHRITVPDGMELPTSESRECSRASVFYENHNLGHCCQFSIVFNKDTMLSVATLVLKFPDPVDAFRKSLPLFSAEWSLLEYPFQQMHPDFEPVSTQGAYVSSYSRSGQVLAVAANQRFPTKTTMLFVSPLTDTVLVGAMKNCGVSDIGKTGRQYWVADIAWTSDNLFLACILKNGSVCLVPRLGDPIPIQTQGCSVNMGPAHFLPLHPAIFVSDNQGSLEPSALEQDPMQQQFSLATHPTLPIVLFSDGFLVTVAQLPVEMTSVSVMRELVLDSARYLKKLYQQENLDMTVADAYKLSKGQKGSKQSLVENRKQRKPYEFELAEISLNATHESDTSIIDTTNKFGFDQFGAIGNMDAGKIVFGEPEMISIDPNTTFSGLEASDALLKYLEESMSALTLVWKLGSSYSDVWTSEVDNITKKTVHNFLKIFEVVLDCPAVDSIIPSLTPRQSSAIQNPRVYNIIVAYRNILQLLRFDTFNQHLITAALRLVHKTITLMLSSKELLQTDPRLKTLYGCYSLLKHAETSLNRIYVWVSSQSQTGTPTSDGSPHRFEPAVMVKMEKQSTGSSSDVRGVHLDNQGQLPGKRLAATWKVLYHHTVEYQSKVRQTGDLKQELPNIDKLIHAIQQVLQEADAQITPRSASAKLSAGDKLSVGGEHTLAVEAWKDQLKMFAGSKKDSPKTARMLHSVLYTYLLKDDLAQTVDFVDNLILQASIDTAMNSQELPAYDDGSRPPLMTLVTHRSQDSEEEELVPCIKNKSIRQTVQTMGRFMAAYFSNETMYIYPPHSAQALPSVHMSHVPTKTRIIPKYHEDITNVIRRDSLSGIWTTERTVEYLLMSGLVCETAWFAHKMGDWKTAYLLSVAHCSHREIAPQLYQRPKKPLQIPESLSPHAILQEKLEFLIKSNKADSTPAGANKKYSRYFIPINQETNIGQLTHTIQDMMTAGIVSDVEIAPWFLASLTDKLKHVVSSLPVLVPEEFYLPAPPLYCPQAGEEEMGRDDPSVQYEKELRLEISSIIQLLLVAFNSAHLTLPTARWYIQDLFKMQEKASQFKATTEGPCLELPEILQQYKILRSDIVEYRDSPNVGQVMSSFRDFCTILWMLHVRDEMSLHLRKRGKQLVNDNQDGTESPESTLGQEYVQECFKILKWAVHLLAFCQYLGDEDCIRKVILSLILELPPTEDTADILAEHFYLAESYHPEVQEKLERLVSSWQSVEIVPEDDGKSARPEEGEDVRRSLDNDDDEDDGSVRKSVTFYQASPRAKTLSVYFYKQCEVVQKVLKKKRKFYSQYDEFVFCPETDVENTGQSGVNSAEAICIGSRPFETKQSYLEFLDRFYAICFTKVVEKESESGRSSMYPVLMPFAKIIREAEFESFLSKYEETYQKKPSSVVMASPRAKFFRSQSESHVSDGYEPKNSPGVARGRSLFRSNSSTAVMQGHHRLSRFESEGSLMTKNSPGRSRGEPPSPSRAKPNMTGMASRFFQSEEVLYKDPGESQEAHWILDVNFGQRYLALQHLLDYLQHWASKQHSLGLHGKDIALKPTMRIEVPTQLVVLGLWLLENKYSSSKLKKQEAEFEREVHENIEYIPKDRARQRALGTVEEITERDSFTQVSNVPRSRSHSPKGQRSRSHSPKADVSRSASAGFDMSKDRTLEYVKSITSTMEETELKSAYKKVLDGYRVKEGDDSSSLEVSSLEPDDLDENLKRSLTATGSGRMSRSKGRNRHKSPRRVESSPETRNNSALNNTMQFDGSPERANRQTPQTSTPLRNNSPANRGRRAEVQADISRISLPPSGGVPGQYTAPPTGKPDYYRGGLLGGDPSRTAPPGGEHVIMPQQSGTVGSAPVNLAGMDLAQQLQHIVRGELRRMMEVQHQSMMAMMGALDGQPPVAWQPEIPANQRQGSLRSPIRGGNQNQIIEEMGARKGKGSIRGVMSELKNLQVTEQKEQKRRKSKSPQGKENIDSSLRMSELRNGENIEVYRVTQDSGINFYPNFLRIPAERDTEGVRFPHIQQEAWGPRQSQLPRQDIPDMPLLHVDRTIPGHKFPVNQRSQLLPRYQPDPGYFQPPPGFSPAQAGPAPRQPPRQPESPDSGIGIPLLRLQTAEEKSKRQPRFGELLPPDVMSEVDREKQQQEMLRERYLREYHELQSEKAKEQYKQRFGDRLLHLNLKSVVEEEAKISPRKAQTPRKSHPRKTPSPRKTPRSLSEQLSSKSSKKSSARKKPEADATEGGELLSEKGRIREEVEEEAESRQEEEEEESEEEDVTEADSMEEEEELHDGYAIKQGEFEAYLALENALSKTKDTHARIQLKTALRLQRQRMMENWKRPKVDFATNTAEMLDAGIDADFVPQEPEYIRTSEKATSITKDTGVDPIQEAVIEYNQSRQANVLPPDIYMGLRFNSADSQESRGRNYLNVVDLDASAVLNDLRERPEPTEPQLDKSLSPDQQHIRNRMAQEDDTRLSFEPPVIERPTRADELTLKIFETKMQDHDRLSLAIIPRDSMPDSKYAIMQRLRDMNSQLSAIDHMSNNIEREFKSTRLALGTLEDMTNAMEPATSQDILEEDQRLREKLVDSREDISSPLRSAKSPTPSAKMTARSTARSKKSAAAGEERREMSVELAKLSGLSGISDIIGDMVAKGDIDLDDVGLSQREANRLVQRGAIRKDQVHEARVSLDEIKKMAETAHKDGAQDKEALRTWMVNKRHQQMAEYKRHLEELREREPRPFKPKHEDSDFSMTVAEKKALTEAREESRKNAKKAFMTKRLDEAQNLLGNILSDKPDLPKDLPARVATPKRKPAKDRSPVSVRGRTPLSTGMKGRSQGRKLQGILKTRDVSPHYEADYSYDREDYGDLDLEDDWLMEQQTYQEEPRPVPIQSKSDRTHLPPWQIAVQPAREPSKGKKPAGLVPKLKLSLEDVHEEEPLKLQQTAETTGDLSEYYKAVEAMDVSSSHEHAGYVARQPVEREAEVEPEPQKTFKVTPYTKLVKVQRPERTRKQVNKFAQAYNREQARLSISESARTSARTEMSDRERQMIYGSKRLPAKRPTETTPRRIKTYTERLQEMKTGQKYSTPVAPKSHLGSSIASTTARPTSHPVKPKHKPVTYVEQLQKLNQGHHKPRVGSGTMTVQKPMIKSHKPLHKPKTYAQQLQDLQPQKTFKVPPSKRVHKPGVSRQRPYRDPYTSMAPDDLDRMETASVVSAWSMGDDVRDILYNDVESSIAVGQSASYAPSEQVSDYYDAVMGDLGDDYTASVDIDDLVQIADGGSVSSGSMMSFIDWDQVDDLIADVR
ncbi:ciliogenesis and planar polarity effector 1-like isoform X3 [Mercenaria mercenaria]|uniref:ciliogenesis and planar polarity effector 1-like isoform X3 n=1 Tax=Mercenaria mercenaria TaxID=6596 RepID=UPI00234E7801|nr:ciliogenesis and planar polarity effector 1-like isoform X3 [Mercenaria mercenaria]